MTVNNTKRPSHSNREFLNQVKHLVKQRQYDTLGDLFLEHLANLSEPLILNNFWEAIDYLSEINQETSFLAKELSLLIADHLIENRQYQEALVHFQKVSRYINANDKIRPKIIYCYKQLYQEKPHFNECLRKSGIVEQQPLDEALSAFNMLIQFESGTPVFSSRYGYGEIKNIDFLLDTITIEFYDRTPITITLEQAIKSLQIVSQDNFFILRAKRPEQLKKMIRESPEELLTIIKRDVVDEKSKLIVLDTIPELLQKISQPMAELKSSLLKQLLKGYLDDAEIEYFITQIKKKTTQSHKKSILTDSQNTILSKIVKNIEKLTTDEILEQLNHFSPSQITTELLKAIRNRHSAGTGILMKLFLSHKNKRILQSIYNLLTENERMEIINKIDTEYKTYPEHFLWLTDVKTKEKEYLSNPLSDLVRFLDIATNIMTKQYASVVRKKIVASDYALIRKGINEVEPNLAIELWTKLNRINTLYPEELDRIKSIFQQRFPEIFSEKEDCLYNTKSAIRNKEQELKHIISEELPNCANEVARARSFGDLSENYEYKAALEKQRRLMNKVTQIQKELAKVRPIDFTTIDTSRVNIGTTVKLLPLDYNSEQNIITYTILGPWDSDLTKGIISYLAPFAQTLLGKRVGDEIVDEQGKHYRIIEINKCLFND
ncbi:MAG: GreA/GreB family elongation factor [candidate division WOR-3 bacterium]|nr:GreA/GreB family elongation factor [candidate division WOR-3 bacterium]